MNKMNEITKDLDTSVETENSTASGASVEVARREPTAEVEYPSLNISTQRTSDTAVKDITAIQADEANERLPSTPDVAAPAQDQPLIEQSTFVSSALPSSELDAVVAADSLLLPSDEHHSSEDRVRLSTPSDSIDMIDSSAEDASTPYQAYLNSSPPTSVIFEGARRADKIQDTEAVEKSVPSDRPVPDELRSSNNLVQKSSDQHVFHMEHPACEDVIFGEESSTVIVEESVVCANANANTETGFTQDRNAASTEETSMPSGSSSKITRKRSASFAEPDETKKRLRQDQSAATHEELDITAPGLAHATPIESKQEEMANAFNERVSPPSSPRTKDDKSEELRPSTVAPPVDQDIPRAKADSANVKLPEEEEESSLSSSSSEESNTLKRRRSRRFEADVEHVQLSTPPKRYRQSPLQAPLDRTVVPSAEQKSSTPHEFAGLHQAEKDGDNCTNNSTKNSNKNTTHQNVPAFEPTAPSTSPPVDLYKQTEHTTPQQTSNHNLTQTPHPPFPSPSPSSPSPQSPSLAPSPSPSPSPSTTPSSQPPPSSQNTPTRRPKAKPASIIGRLRRVLSDCRQLVLGSQEEEREFDDVLFEVRREVHEAGRRGREGRDGRDGRLL